MGDGGQAMEMEMALRMGRGMGSMSTAPFTGRPLGVAGLRRRPVSVSPCLRVSCLGLQLKQLQVQSKLYRRGPRHEDPG